MFAASKTDSASTGGYQISRSLRFNSADSAYLNRTPASATNRKTWTYSAWVKRSKSGDFRTIFSAATDTSNLTIIRFKDDDKIEVRSATAGSTVFQLVTTQVFRDYSAWYHFVLAVDTTNATGGDRVRLYVNGSEVTTFDTDTIPTPNADSWINNNILHEIARQANNASNYYQDGYMTEMYLIDGTQLTPSSFGETNAQTGVWQPKAYSGSYGTNGFYLNFSDNSNTTAATLGKDYSGNGNNWTPNNFSVTAGIGNDSMVDTPTPYGIDTGVGGTVRGNYCTINPLDGVNSATITNGNLNFANGGTATFRGTIAAPASSGKWYWEFTQATTVNSGNPVAYGMSSVQGSPSHSAPQRAAFYQTDGSYKTLVIYNNGAYVNSQNVATTIGINDTLQFAYDSDTGKVWVGKSGAWADSSGGTTGNPATGANPTFTMAGYDQAMSPTFDHAGVAYTASLNCGQQAFVNTAPSGFKALCTQNLPTPTIGATTATQANLYFTPNLRVGTGASGSTISTTVNMANGALLWDKSRSAAGSHYLVDSVRGISNALSSNSTGAEASFPSWFTNFGTNSYTVGSSDWSTGITVVDWIWAANGAGSTNTAGSITSTVSANTTSGFSVVTYTGNGSLNATFGHGLGVVPSMIIVKSRSNANAWPIYHSALGANKYIYLNLTQAPDTVGGLWGASGPSSSLVYLPTSTSQGEVNGSGTTYVAYCFAEVAGYSKIGSYTGNGSADGAFIYMGFRPAYVLIKRTDTGGYDWWIMDATRSPTNAVRARLYANTSDAEVANDDRIDFVSNGIKLRNAELGFNANGGTYIYMAFASNPFKYSLAR